MLHRGRLALLAVLAVGVVPFVFGTSSAAAATTTPPPCKVISFPSFVDQGEFATHSSVADIVRVGCKPRFAGSTVTITANQVYLRCQNNLSWSPPFPAAFTEGPKTTVTLDDDGNATVAFWGGPGCAQGSSVISAHLNTAPFTTVSTKYFIKVPQVTPQGVRALPQSEIEDATTSSVAVVIEVEFAPQFAERTVQVSSSELNSRCQKGGITWIGPDETPHGTGDTTVVTLDNNGNGFVVALAGASCAAGVSQIEASLVGPPFITYTNTFRILSPRPLYNP